MRKFALQLLFLVCCTLISHAQLLTVAPAFPNDGENITIVFDASKGNRGLFNYAGDLYLHTGVITEKSSGHSDWKYVPTQWNTNNSAYKLTPLGNNKYEFKINGIRSFYGVPPGETILKLAFVFRSYNPSGNALEGKCSDLSIDQGNMYWDVYPPNSHAIRFTQPEFEPRYSPFLMPLSVVVGSNLNLSAVSSKNANLSIRMNGTVLQVAGNSNTISGTATLNGPGSYFFEAVSNDGITTVQDQFNIYVSPAVITEPLPAGLKEGINYEGENAATLVLYAPGKARVNLIGDFNDWTESSPYQMKQTPDGKYFWLRISGLTPAKEYAYQYLVDGQLKIGDPYCEKILDPWNDQYIDGITYPNLKPYPVGKTTGIVSILQSKQDAYSWKASNFQRPDKRKLVIYEVLLRDFLTKHDWTTLKDSIGYFKSLGVNALQLMPFNEFEGNLSWGYNPSYYFAPDKFYGSKNSLKAFIDECHKNGIAVIMDMVLNHSFAQSPMVQLYFDNVAGRPAANNPWFNPVAKHAFNVGYDFNHESIDTKRFFNNVCSFWLNEYKLDGFRFDLSKGFTQKKTCDDNGGNCNVNDWTAYDASRIAIWKDYYNKLQQASPDSYVILEHLGVNEEEKELSDFGIMLWGNMNYNFTEAAKGVVNNSNFQWALHSNRGWANPHLVSYMESHDEERSMYKCLTEGQANGSYNIKDLATGLKRNEMTAAFLLAMPGPKLIWQFGELGYDLSINTCDNGSINNNCRTDQKPIKWNYYQDASRVKLRNVYKSLLELRKNIFFNDLFAAGTVNYDLGTAIKWLSLVSDTSKLVVIGNFGLVTASKTISLPQAGTWINLLTGGDFASTGKAQNIKLAAGEYMVLLNRDLGGKNPIPGGEISEDGELSLQVNPNPLTSQSIIQYQVSEAATVNLLLYDLNARLIYKIFQGTRAKGNYLATLNPMFLSSLQSGIYIVQLQVNDKKRSHKVVVIGKK